MGFATIKSLFGANSESAVD